MENQMKYIALVDGKPGAYGVVVPDLPGCTSGGATIEAACRNAIEAVRLWIEDALADGERLPSPRRIDEVAAAPEVAPMLATGRVALVLIPVLRDTGRAVKANVSLDAGTLEAIDDAAKVHGLTRSAFIASAAREKILRGG
jgi:predicted RNase H-like HicB family nuclease